MNYIKLKSLNNLPMLHFHNKILMNYIELLKLKKDKLHKVINNYKLNLLEVILGEK